jgi:hypothetical protein
MEDSGSLSDDSAESAAHAVAVDGEGKRGDDPTVGQSEAKVDPPVAPRTLPLQFDGFEEGVQLGHEMEESDNRLLHESSSIESNPSHSLPASGYAFRLEWENTRLRTLLRRQQLETEHLSAQHFMQVVALRDESAANACLIGCAPLRKCRCLLFRELCTGMPAARP